MISFVNIVLYCIVSRSRFVRMNNQNSTRVKVQFYIGDTPLNTGEFNNHCKNIEKPIDIVSIKELHIHDNELDLCNRVINSIMLKIVGAFDIWYK